MEPGRVKYPMKVLEDRRSSMQIHESTKETLRKYNLVEDEIQESVLRRVFASMFTKDELFDIDIAINMRIAQMEAEKDDVTPVKKLQEKIHKLINAGLYKK